MSTRNARNGEQFLKLCSPAGAPAATYKWPLIKKENVNEATEIVETIEWVARDFHEVHYAVDTFIMEELDTNSFDSMKQLCDKYNRAITNIRKLWSGRQPPSCLGSSPCPALLKHVMTQVYNHAIDNAGLLNHYEPFSPEVYGETSYELVEQVIKEANVTENDIFLDLGSGVGNVVLQVAGAVMPKECIGIEKADKPAKYAEDMERHFVKWMKWYGKCCGDFELIKGDFLSPEFSTVINKATIIFVNNFAFGPVVNHQLKLKFQNLSDGVRIVSSAEFCSINFRINDRNLGDIGAMMDVHLLSPLKGQVSWTNKPVNFYLQIIDRTLLEKYFYYKNHPEEEPPEELRRKLYPKEAQDLLGGDEEGEQKASSETPSAPAAPKVKAKWSPATKNQLLQQFSDRFARQISSFMTHIYSPGQQPKLKQMIQREKARREHLKTIIKSLEEEVDQLQSSSAVNMENCMERLNLVPHTPEALARGEKTITNRNRRLKRDVSKLESDISSLKKQVDAGYRLMQKNGIQCPQELRMPKQFAQKKDQPYSNSTVDSETIPSSNRLPSVDGSSPDHSRAPITGLEQLLRVSELELLKSGGEPVTGGNRSSVASSVNSPVPPEGPSAHAEMSMLLQRTEQSRDEVLAAETLSSLASIGSSSIVPQPHAPAGGTGKKNRPTSASKDSLVIRSHRSSQPVTSPQLASFDLAGQFSHTRKKNHVGSGTAITVPDQHIMGESGEDGEEFALIIERVDKGAKQGLISSQKTFSKFVAAPPVYLASSGVVHDVPSSSSADNSPVQSNFSNAQTPTLSLPFLPTSTASKASPSHAMMSPHPHRSPPIMFMVPPPGAVPVEGGMLVNTPTVKSAPTSEAPPLKPVEGISHGFVSSGRKRLSPEARLSSSRKTSTSGSPSEGGVDSPAATPLTEPSNTMGVVGGGGALPMLKPGEFPPFFPTFIPMAAMSKSSSGPTYSTINSLSTPTSTSSSSATGSTYPNLLYGMNGQSMQTSKMFSALDLQQPSQPGQSAQKPQMLPFFSPMMNYPGFSGSPTSLPPTSGMLFPGPFLMPPHISTANSAAGQGQNWMLPGAISSPPFPFQPPPFQMMGLPSPQQLAMMKSLNGGSKDISTSSHTPPAQNRVVQGNSQLQDASPSGGPIQGQSLFSPTFPGLPTMMPSPLLMGTFATPTSQTLQPSSSGSSGGLPSSGSGSTREGQPKRKYQRRRPKQQQQQQRQQQQQEKSEGLSTLAHENVPRIDVGSSDLNHAKPMDKKQAGGQRKTAKKSKDRSAEPYHLESRSLSPSVMEDNSQSSVVLSGSPAPLSVPGTEQHTAFAEDERRKVGLDVPSGTDVRETAHEGDRNQTSMVSTTPGTSTDVSSVDTGFTSGHDDLELGSVSNMNTESCAELTKNQDSQRDGSKTCSPNSLVDASNLLSLRQPFTFGNQEANNACEGAEHPVSSSKESGPTLSTKSGEDEGRKGRTSSMSAAEAMLMLNSTHKGEVDGSSDGQRDGVLLESSHEDQNTPTAQYSPLEEHACTDDTSARENYTNCKGSAEVSHDHSEETDLQGQDGMSKEGHSVGTNGLGDVPHLEPASSDHNGPFHYSVRAQGEDKPYAFTSSPAFVTPSASEPTDSDVRTEAVQDKDCCPSQGVSNLPTSHNVVHAQDGVFSEDVEQEPPSKKLRSNADATPSSLPASHHQVHPVEGGPSVDEEGAPVRKDSGSLLSPSSLTSLGSLVSTDTAAKGGEEDEDFPREEAEFSHQGVYSHSDVIAHTGIPSKEPGLMMSLCDMDTTNGSQALRKEMEHSHNNSNDSQYDSTVCVRVPYIHSTQPHELPTIQGENDLHHDSLLVQTAPDLGTQAKKSFFKPRKTSHHQNYRRRQSEDEHYTGPTHERSSAKRNGESNHDHYQQHTNSHHHSSQPRHTHSKHSPCDKESPHHWNGHHYGYHNHDQWKHHMYSFKLQSRNSSAGKETSFNNRKRSSNFKVSEDSDRPVSKQKRPSV